MHSREGSTKKYKNGSLILTEANQRMLEKGYHGFCKKFGSHFIGKIYSGAVFFCKISGETKNSKDMHDVSSEIKTQMELAILGIHLIGKKEGQIKANQQLKKYAS